MNTEGRICMKVVIVGDSGVGKTTMIHKFVYGRYENNCTPTVYDNYAVTHLDSQSSYVLSIFDTSGQDQYTAVRALSYLGCDVVIVCFSVTSPTSFKSVEATWAPELRRFCPRVPTILVGMKTDLRERKTPESNQHTENRDTNSSELLQRVNSAIRDREGMLMRGRIGAAEYVECYRDQDRDVTAVFECAVTAVNSAFKKKRSYNEDDSNFCSCQIM